MGNRDSFVRDYPGVGNQKAQAYARLGIETSEELLRFFPRAYQHRGDIRTLKDAPENEYCAFNLTIADFPSTVTLKGRLRMTKLHAFDGTGRCTLIFFNQPYLQKVFVPGQEYRFWGKLSRKNGRPELAAPKYELSGEGVKLPEFTALYRLTKPLTQKTMAVNISLALSLCAPIPELLSDRIRSENGLVTASEAYRCVHFPTSFAEINAGKRYFMFEELYLFGLSLGVMGINRKTGRAHAFRALNMDEFTSALPFSLTGAQARAIDDIISDMCRQPDCDGCISPMSRIITGDVGCGKTAVAAAAAWICCKNGAQAALMAPTEILANQHYNDLKALLSPLGIRTELLTGSLGASQKRAVRERLENGDVDLIIGTHALISSGVKFRNAGLVITDEQHRFGVRQRAALGSGDGIAPHVLVMSATPIPRTLALTLYGDLDISKIDEMPPGRQKVDTFYVGENYRERLNAFIREQVNSGGQVYIVCPSIEEKEKLPQPDDGGGEIIPFDYDDRDDEEDGKPKLKSAIEYSEKLKTEIFPEFRIEFIHGRMKSTEKDRIMNDFAQGRIQILVSTTVIEVGVNVPNASLMIVENAERFGLSQLHQLRGRVGRGARKSYCVLISDDEGESARGRLSIMKDTSDGLKIAEYDLKTRGPGDFFPTRRSGARQHGSLEMIPSGAGEDMELLEAAFREAKATLESDPSLKNAENIEAGRRLARLFEINAREMQ